MRTPAMFILIMIVTAACSNPLEAKYKEGYEAGYEEGLTEGREQGKSEAIECVRSEGGGAGNAADSCE